MANNKGMTKVQAFTIALELVKNSTHASKDEVCAKISKEIENLSNRKPTTKEAIEQEVRRNRGELLIDFLREHRNERFTVTQLQTAVPGFPAEISNSAVTSLFRLPNVIAHHIRTVDKGRAYYQYAD
jgi:hypothetical protein